MNLISIDPGKSKIAWARWSLGELGQVGLEQGELSDLVEWVRKASRWSVLAIERPQVYQQSKGDPNDLIDVAITVGLCTILAPKQVFYLPRQWKGQVPKNIHQPRIITLLSDEEKARLGKYAKQSDVLDAVGIGLYHLGRRYKGGTKCT